ncbi:MAG: hypothetical protein R2682_02005 [Pyrinomonadaceae bacterium]
MAKKKRDEADSDDLAGTVEGLARDHFEMEKAAYEKRTGQTVEYVPPMPVTRTPIVEPAETEEASPEDVQQEEETMLAGTANDAEGDKNLG